MGIIHTILNPVFSPLLVLGPIYAIICLAVIINLISSVLTKKFVDTHKMKSLQVEMKEHRTIMLASAKSGGEKDKKTVESETRMMEIQQELMKLQMPMFFTIVPVLFVFIWMKEAFTGFELLVTLPYNLPIWGNTLGWLGWYILSAMPMSILIRKLLKIS